MDEQESTISYREFMTAFLPPYTDFIEAIYHKYRLNDSEKFEELLNIVEKVYSVVPNSYETMSPKEFEKHLDILNKMSEE